MEKYLMTSSTEHARAATACGDGFGAGSRVRGELGSPRTTTVNRINVDVAGPRVWSPPV